MKFVLAPDSFKGSLTSLQAAETMKNAILSLNSKHDVALAPMADGGEGTVDALLAAAGGEKIPLHCTGPLGDRIDSYYGRLPDGTAVIETANTAGLVLVRPEKRNPDYTTTYGLGEAILDALDKGCTSFIIGLGGSATNDGGFGMLRALGMEAVTADGRHAGIFGKDMLSVHQINLDKLDSRLRDCKIQVACDVNNPLCGPNGATAVYGPQKGISPHQEKTYDQALFHFAGLIQEQTGHSCRDAEGAGAAGGLGFALLTLGALLVSGAELIAEASGIEEEIKTANLVITGEGQSDEQTLYGKAPSYIAGLAKKHCVPVILISGSIGRNAQELNTLFDAYFSILPRPMALEEAMHSAAELLYGQARQAAALASVFMKKRFTEGGESTTPPKSQI